MDPQGFGHWSFPYRTPAALRWLRSGWLVTGIVISLLFFVLLLLEEFYTSYRKRREKRKLESSEEGD